ncbi:CbrC family protein [Idiomarina sp.]|uniref:CbrC family protein n=1 Tax=Idiomarina sp. TaxID=1874361 RepID=UPI003A8E6467
MEFEFFRYPEKFAYKVDKPKPCSVCGKVDLCFDVGGYAGINDIDCICTDCLKAGALIELGIEPNMNFDDGSKAAETITYKTPALPTWQDIGWPMVAGEFPVFDCIASAEDFSDKTEFLNAFIEEAQKIEDIEWLWDRLPKKKLKHYSEGGDISVYLFTLKGKKYWIWDAN